MPHDLLQSFYYCLLMAPDEKVAKLWPMKNKDVGMGLGMTFQFCEGIHLLVLFLFFLFMMWHPYI